MILVVLSAWRGYSSEKSHTRVKQGLNKKIGRADVCVVSDAQFLWNDCSIPSWLLLSFSFFFHIVQWLLLGFLFLCVCLCVGGGGIVSYMSPSAVVTGIEFFFCFFFLKKAFLVLKTWCSQDATLGLRSEALCFFVWCSSIDSNNFPELSHNSAIGSIFSPSVWPPHFTWLQFADLWVCLPKFSKKTLEFSRKVWRLPPVRGSMSTAGISVHNWISTLPLEFFFLFSW